MEDLHTRLVQPLQAHWKGADRIGEVADDVIELLELERTGQFVFWVLSTFGPIPILQSVATRVESMVLSAIGAKGSGLLIAHLLDAHLLRVYPSLIVMAMSGEAVKRIPLYTVPSLVCDSALRAMSIMDATFAIAVAHKALVLPHPPTRTTTLLSSTVPGCVVVSCLLLITSGMPLIQGASWRSCTVSWSSY